MILLVREQTGPVPRRIGHDPLEDMMIRLEKETWVLVADG